MATIESYQEPVRLFQSLGTILGHPAIRLCEDVMLLYRQFCEMAFSRIDVEGPRIVALYAQAQYRELFAISLVSRGWHGAVERT